MFELSNRTAVVTGGGQGFGETFAHGLAREGAKVAIFDIDLKKAERVAEAIATEAGGQSLAVEVDVSNKDQVDRGFARVDEEVGPVDILVNNAGIWSFVPALELTLDEWMRVINVNLTGTLLCAQAAARLMLPREHGSIINIASISGALGFKQRTAYATTKHGVRGLTKQLANEWAEQGVRVNAIGPGSHDGGMAGAWRADPEVLKNDVLRNIPMKRLGDPEELLGPLMFLASDASSYVTGQTVFSDGGWLLE